MAKIAKILDAVAKTGEVNREEMMERVARAFNRTWETVASDTISCITSEGGKGVLNRNEVYDATADYVDMYGKDNVATEWWFALDRKKRPPIKRLFPFERYGM